MVSEAAEIEIGQRQDSLMLARGAVHDSPELAAYVSAIGRSVADVAERPHLPWTFRLQDDPTVNAFAYPGGVVYLTRGILANLNSEAQLAGILGHEVAHVTARHSAHEISKQAAWSVFFSPSYLLLPDLTEAIVAPVRELVFLQYGRDDETQADDLSVRYVTSLSYDPRPLIGTFRMLEASALARGGRATPGHLSTHPDPGDRATRTERLINERWGGSGPGGQVRRNEYLRRLEGLVYGPDPRNGYMEDGRFIHPGLALSMTVPPGWRPRKEPTAFLAVSALGEAAVGVGLVPDAMEGSPTDLARRYLEELGVEGSQVAHRIVNGIRVAVIQIQVQMEDSELRGVVGFFEHRGVRLLAGGVAPPADWPVVESEIRETLTSVAPVSDPAKLNVEPARIRIHQLQERMSIREVNQRMPSTIPIEDLARLNQTSPDSVLPAGTLIKRVSIDP
jgi:predicted Zn-dependent protease